MRVISSLITQPIIEVVVGCDWLKFICSLYQDTFLGIINMFIGG
jgi:hypothetical protein